MTRQRIRRGVFRSIADLQTAINAYLAEHNASPKPSDIPADKILLAKSSVITRRVRLRQNASDRDMRHSPTDLSRDGPQRQTLIAQFDDPPNYRLLLWYLDKRAVHTDQPTEGRGAPEKASAL
jgi:hypothetical protein